MKPVTVSSYKFGEKTWKNFEGEPIKKYEHSVLLDISNTEVFSDKEKTDSSKIFHSVT